MLAILLLVFGADIGPKPLSYGGQPTPLKDMPGIEVEMASEDVRLVLHKSKLDVEVVFHMLNHGPDATFEEGFPVGPYRTMKDFAFTIDGKALPFKLVDRKSADPNADRTGESPKDLFKGDVKEPDYWYVWTAAFKAGARHTHVVKYSVDLAHQRFYHQTGYILHTGAAWKNAIGKANVTLTFGDGLSVENLRGVRPFDAARVGSNQVTWTFENLEPTKDHDIVISYDLDTWKKDVETLRADAPKTWASRNALAWTLKQLPGWQGRKDFTPAERKDYLDALGGLVSEGKMEDGKFVFPGVDPERVSGPGGVVFTGEYRQRYFLLEDDILNMFQRSLDETLAVARTHPAEAKATLKLYRDFLGRLAAGELYLDCRKLNYGKNGGKIIPARTLKPAEKATLEAKLAEADALLR